MPPRTLKRAKRRVVPRVLVAGGFDPTGRAGLLADVQAVRAAGGAAVALATALTAQGKRFRCVPVEVSLLRDQLAGVLALGPIDAIKLGVVPNRPALALLTRFARRQQLPLVIDPVTRTSRGERLSTLTAAEYCAVGYGVVTPNRSELEWLATTPETLLERGFAAVVVKGSETAVDALHLQSRTLLLRGPVLAVDHMNHRGTGCRFASVLATRLAAKDPMEAAVRAAKAAVQTYLRAPAVTPLSGRTVLQESGA